MGRAPSTTSSSSSSSSSRRRPCRSRNPPLEPAAVRRRLQAADATARCFCPVPGCGMGDPLRVRRWGSHDAMRHHLDDHCSCTLSGSVPQEYLDAHSLDTCTVCGLLVKRYYNGLHPRCRPAARAQAARTARPVPRAVAGADVGFDILAADVPTIRHVPKAARALRAHCLARATAAAWRATPPPPGKNS